MIKLFQEQDTNFSTNGDLIVKPTRAVVHKEDNGSFYLDLETNFNVEKKYVEPQAGTTIEGTSFQINADTTKEDAYSFLGNNTQETSTQSANLFDEAYYNNDSIYTSDTYKYTLSRIQGNRVLYFKARLKSGKTKQDGVYIAISDSAGKPYMSGTNSAYAISNGNATSQSKDFTGITTLYINIYPNTTDCATIFDNYDIWICTSNSQTYVPFVPAKPSPYYTSDIERVGGEQSIQISGNNLFSGFVKGKGLNPTLGNEIDNSTGAVSDFIQVNIDTTNSVTISGLTDKLNSFIGAYNKDKVFLGRTGGVNRKSITMYYNSFTGETPQGTGEIAYIRIYQYYVSGNTGTIDDVDNLNVMLNKGVTALPYEPYDGNVYKINLGKNLFDGTQVSTTHTGNWSVNFQDNVLTIEHKNTYTTGVPTIDIGYLPKGTYVLSGTLGGNIGLYVNDTYNKLLSNGTSFTCDGTQKITLKFPNSVASTLTYTNIMLEKGKVPTQYSSYFEPIWLDGINNCKDKIFKTSGLNLLDRTKSEENKGLAWAYGTTFNETGSLVSDYIKVDVGKTYQFGYYAQIMFYDSNKTYLGCLQSGGTTIAKQTGITLPYVTIPYIGGIYYIRLGFRASNNGNPSDMTNVRIMVNEGATALSYEPYGTDKWYVEKNIGKKILNGTETWAKDNPLDGSLDYFYIANAGINRNNIDNVMTDHFKKGASNTQGFWATTVFCITIEKQFTGIVSTDTNAERIAKFKSWLSNNNVSVYYQLLTPTTSEITNQDLINQLEAIRLINGTNNIFVTSPYLSMLMNLQYNYVTGGEITTSYVDLLTPNKILVANTPQGEQAFRISNVEKTRTKLKIKANHLFYDSKNYVIKDSYVVEKTCNQALDHLNDAVDTPSPFNMTSDITALHSYRCIRSSLYEAIQVVLERWGGHLVRDDFDIKVMNSIGTDNGVTIRYGKNLKDIDAQYNWENVVTKLMPVGADGLLLTEEYLYSSTTYDIPYTKVVSFDQSNIEKDNYETDDAYNQALMDDLRAKGQAYLETNCIPMVNYTLNANLEKISDVGDTIQVIDERLGVELMTNLIAFDFDCIMERYTQVQFGNFKPTLNNLMTTIAETTTEQININNEALKVTLGQELEDATDKIWSTLGNSYVIYDGDKILVLDALPKENATNVIMISNGGIGFSNTGINGTFSSAWTIDNTLNMENINVINLTADLIRGGVLKLGSNLNQYGQIEIYNETNTLIAEMNKNGLKMYGIDGSYVLLNNQVGLAGYDRNDTKIYWADGNAFHMKKSEVEEEITLCGKMRYIPIQIRSGNTITNDGIGLVSVLGGGN